MTRLARCASSVLASCLLLSPSLYSQEASSPSVSAPVYKNDAGGLRRLLEDAMQAARSGNNAKLVQIVEDMRIPDYDDGWFQKTFGEEKGDSWADPYAAHLEENDRQMRDLLTRISRQEGQFTTTKGRDSLWAKAAKSPLDVFSAEWKAKGASNSKFVGLFFFVDGKFRWYSGFRRVNVSSVPLDTTRNKLPLCSFCPSVAYTPEARAAKFQGTVVLAATIETDGHASNIVVIRSAGYGLDEKAVEALQMWRFIPAKDPDGNPVAVRIPIEMSFRLI